MMAQAEGRFRGSSVTENDITEALSDGLDKCQKILQDRLANANKINSHDGAVSGPSLSAWTLSEIKHSSHSDIEMENFGIANDVDTDLDFLSDQFPSQWIDQTWF
jgi:hypothetical protein